MDFDLVNTRPSSRVAQVKVTKRAVAASMSSGSESSDGLVEIEDMMDHRSYVKLSYYAPQTSPANREWLSRANEPPPPSPVAKKASLPPPTITLREDSSPIEPPDIKEREEERLVKTLSPESETIESLYQPKLLDDDRPNFAPIPSPTDLKSLEHQDSAETQAESPRETNMTPPIHPDIPDEYATAAEHEHLDVNVLKPFFSEDGFVISKAISALRSQHA